VDDALSINNIITNVRADVFVSVSELMLLVTYMCVRVVLMQTVNKPSMKASSNSVNKEVVAKKTIKSGVSNKPVQLWTPEDVVEWMKTVRLGSKRSQYIAAIAEESTDGKDLLALAVDGKKNFQTEMKETYGIMSLYSRRMYNSLMALSKHKTVESNSKSPAHSRFTSDVDPSETPYSSPIYGVMKLSLMSLRKACAPLKDVVDDLDKSVYFAKMAMAAGQHGKGIDKNGLTLNERAAIHIYTQSSPFYSTLNKSLRVKNRSVLIPFFPYLKLLLTALAKLPTVKGTFWRGVRRELHKDFADKKEKKQNHFFWSFKSTTLNASVLETSFLGKKGKRTLLNIHGFSGVRIEEYSALADEAEVLFAPGSCFNVTNLFTPGPDLWIVELVQIKHPKFSLIS